MECVLHIGRSLTPHRANAPPAIVSFLFVAIFEPAASPPRNRFSSMQTGAEGSASALDERPNGGKHSEKQVRLALRRSLGLTAAPTRGQKYALSSFPGRGARLSGWARPGPTRPPSHAHVS